MADDRDSLLREVDEELRREQMQKIWERYSGLILGAAALHRGCRLAATSSGSRSAIAAAETAGAEFAAAVHLADENKTDDARKAFEKIAEGGSQGIRGARQVCMWRARTPRRARAAEALADL